MAYYLNVSPTGLVNLTKKEDIPHTRNGKEYSYELHHVLGHLDPSNVMRGLSYPRFEFPGGTNYLLHAVGSEFYKIGYSASSLSKRLTQLQCGCPYDLTVRATRPGTFRDEKHLQYYFAKFRLHGRSEWFQIRSHWSKVVRAFLDFAGQDEYEGELIGGLYGR